MLCAALSLNGVVRGRQGQEKMSKSDPNSAIFMEDTPQEVNSKIKKAFCAPQVVEGNPCLAYVKLIIIPYFGHFQLTRSEANGGPRFVFCPCLCACKACFSGSVPDPQQVVHQCMSELDSSADSGSS